MASAMERTRGQAPHYVLLCDRVTYPPHPSLLRSWFLLPTGVCWPTSTDSFPCALSPSHFRPGGATSSGAGICPHPPEPAVDCSADLSACLCRAPSLPRPFSPASDCWRCRPRVLALIVLLVPERSACSAGDEFSRGTALRTSGLLVLGRGLSTRRVQCGGALPLGVATSSAMLPLRGLPRRCIVALCVVCARAG